MARPPTPPAVVTRAMSLVAGRVPGVALIETLGRRTGRPHRVPISDGVHGDEALLVAEHGRQSDWVCNVEVTPLMRLRSRGGWRAGVAEVVDPELVPEYIAGLSRGSAAAVKVAGTDLLPVRVRFEPHPEDPGDGWLTVNGIAASPVEEVFEFLSDLSNHDWIGARSLDVVAVDYDADGRGSGAQVVLRGPLRPTRRARTVIEHRDAPDLLEGTIRVDSGAQADIRWELAALGGGTRVRLAVRSTRLGRGDRVWLAAGGQRWLASQLDAVLVRLARRLADTPT